MICSFVPVFFLSLSFKNDVFQRAPILFCYEKFTRTYTLPSATHKIAHGLQSYLTMIHGLPALQHLQATSNSEEASRQAKQDRNRESETTHTTNSSGPNIFATITASQ